MRCTDRHRLERYFHKGGDYVVIGEDVKRLVEFHQMNLTAPCSGGICDELHELDAIFCRNVLIYFSPEDACGLVRKLSDRLKPSGHLFLGHAESHFQRSPDLESRRRDDSFYYVKGGAVTPPTFSSLQLPRQVSAVPSPSLPQAPGPVLPQQPKTVASNEVEIAQRLFDTERIDEALQVLDALLTRSPLNTGALVLKGFIVAAKGQLSEALEAARTAIGINDLLPEAYFLKGMVLESCGRLNDAAEEYRRSLLLDSNFVMPRYCMGRVHLKLGRKPEAAREIRNSIKIVTRNCDEAALPYSGGLSRTVCLERLQNALAQVA